MRIRLHFAREDKDNDTSARTLAPLRSRAKRGERLQGQRLGSDFIAVSGQCNLRNHIRLFLASTPLAAPTPAT